MTGAMRLEYFIAVFQLDESMHICTGPLRWWRTTLCLADDVFSVKDATRWLNSWNTCVVGLSNRLRKSNINAGGELGKVIEVRERI